MFRQMRRTAQQLPREECLEILRAATSGVLAVHGDDGYPYTVPLSYIIDGDSIFFHCAAVGHKLDAIRADEKVSFCVVTQDDVVPETYSTDYRSVVVFGRARVIEDAERKLNIIRKLAVRYAPRNTREHMQREIDESMHHLTIVEITMEHITGKESLNLSRQRNQHM